MGRVVRGKDASATDGRGFSRNSFLVGNKPGGDLATWSFPALTFRLSGRRHAFALNADAPFVHAAVARRSQVTQALRARASRASTCTKNQSKRSSKESFLPYILLPSKLHMQTDITSDHGGSITTCKKQKTPPQENPSLVTVIYCSGTRCELNIPQDTQR